MEDVGVENKERFTGVILWLSENINGYNLVARIKIREAKSRPFLVGHTATFYGDNVFGNNGNYRKLGLYKGAIVSFLYDDCRYEASDIRVENVSKHRVLLDVLLMHLPAMASLVASIYALLIFKEYVAYILVMGLGLWLAKICWDALLEIKDIFF